MFKYLLFYLLAAHAICAKPVEVPSHIVIVTPQAQVHLEPAVKYDTATAFIHHLSPLARIASPHEETIVYVPASAAAPIIPLESVSVGRAGGNAQPQQQKTGSETKQFDQIQQQIQQAIAAGGSMLGPQLSEAASAAASAASSAGQGLFPTLFPPSENKDDKTKPDKITYETPAATETLVPASARLYALAPAVSHVVDFMRSPVFVGPLSAIRARSIPESESAAATAPVFAVPLPAAQRPEALPLKLQEELNAPNENAKELLKEAEPEKKSEFGRFLEANVLKEEQPEQPQQQQLDAKDAKKEILKFQEPQEPLIAAKPLADEPVAPPPAPALAQLKTVAPAVNAEAAVAPLVAPAVVPQVAAVVGEDVVLVPQVKVA